MLQLLIGIIFGCIFTGFFLVVYYSKLLKAASKYYVTTTQDLKKKITELERSINFLLKEAKVKKADCKNCGNGIHLRTDETCPICNRSYSPH